MTTDEKRYLEYVASLPCCHCGMPAQAHHIIGIGAGKMGGKADHACTMPLCYTCHAEVHKAPGEWPQAMWLVKTIEQARKDGRLVIQ